MIKAVFYKEWIKARWYLLIMFIVTLGFTVFPMLKINRAVSLRGQDHIWQVMILKDVVFVNILEYIPLIAGLLTALVQFVPEMHNKCIKLTLHLPVTEFKAVYSMLWFGLISLIVCFSFDFIIMGLYLHTVLPFELQWRILFTMLPWYLSGLLAYSLFSWICLEPSWKMRILNIVVSILLLRIYHIESVPEAYNGFDILLFVYVVLSFSLAWLSVTRFKAGKQD